MRSALLLNVLFWTTGCPGTGPNDSDSGQPVTDPDGDGFVPATGDCDDQNALAYPGATELCDGIDNDCDGVADEGGGGPWYPDNDGDGWGSTAGTSTDCEAPEGYVDQWGDCNDGEETVHPGATEVCEDGIDNDCERGDADCPVAARGIAELAQTSLMGAAVEENLGWFPPVDASHDFDLDGRADVSAYSNGSGEWAGAWNVWLDPLAGDTLTTRLDHRVKGQPGMEVGWGAWVGDLDGDGTLDALVGAPGDDRSSAHGGGVYRVDPLGGEQPLGTSTRPWLSPVTEAEQFGACIAAADGMQGAPTIAVGAPLSVAGGAAVDGAVYLFGHEAGAVDPTPVATVAASEIGGQLGRAFVIAPDLDGDGFDDLAASQESAKVGRSAAVFAGPLAGELGWADATAELLPDPFGNLGWDLAAAGDLDGDGYGDLVVADPTGGSPPGHVYVVHGPLVGALTITDVASTDVAATGGDRLGFVVKLGEVTGDGVPDLVAGAPYYQGKGGYPGAVWVLPGPLGHAGVVEAEAWPGSVGISGDEAKKQGEFGSALALGDLDADGRDDLVVGGPLLGPSQQGMLYTVLAADLEE